MIILTGAAGFIGSAVLNELNFHGKTNIICVDTDLSANKFRNLSGKKFKKLISSLGPTQFDFDPSEIEVVIHLGAITDTNCDDWNKLYTQNVLSTRMWYDFCQQHKIPMVFSSSAAVYGNGDGPISEYGFSKFASEQELDNAVILRLFNVYGPNEYHKGSMSSVIHQWYHQINETGKLDLFVESDLYRRDFIHVSDVAKVIHHFAFNHCPGIYDVGTGVSVDYASVAEQVLDQLGGSKIEIPMPEQLVDRYQTYTQANTEYLKIAGPQLDYIPLKVGIKMYTDALKDNRYI